MDNPVNKIEIWEPGAASPLYSITNGVVALRCKTTATSNIGNFSFILPARKDSTKQYEDIDLYDIVKIFLGYDTPPASPLFQGHIELITGLMSGTGFLRQFVGSDRGEILARRLKRNYRWNDRQAAALVTDLANDLGLGTGEIAADTTQEKITVNESTYLDVLKKASDYWASGGSQVKKDFFVDIANALNWKARPIRTSGVEHFAIGESVIAYTVQRSLQEVFNKIWVFGAYGKQDDADTYTEATTNWTAGAGCTMGTDAAHKAAGTVAVKSTADLSTFINDFYYAFANPIERYKTFTLNWDHSAYVISARKIRLCCEDLNNYFEADIPSHSPPGSFEQISFDLGPAEEYDAVNNPEGIWHIVGHTHWNNIKYVRFIITSGTAGLVVWMDGDWGFKKGAYRSTASDPTSQSNYGQRDLLIEDEKLANDSECQSRAEALLYQHKDPPIQLEMLVPGNTNVLVGDRLPITIPEENLSSQNFEVFSVEHIFDKNGFRTRFLATNSINVRSELPSSSAQALLKSLVTSLSSIHQNVRAVK